MEATGQAYITSLVRLDRVWRGGAAATIIVTIQFNLRKLDEAPGRLKDCRLIDRIRWQGHGSFAIEGQPGIQIAPWRVVRTDTPPDVILIGHDSFDHCSPADVEKIRGENTVVIGSESAARVIPDVKVLREWQNISVDRASITAIPAATRRPTVDVRLGFLISMDLYDIYYVGESNTIPDVRHFKPDIILLPIDGYGRLTVEAGLELVEIMKPAWAVPYNWGGAGAEATELDAQSFRSRISGPTEALLLPVNP